MTEFGGDKIAGSEYDALHSLTSLASGSVELTNQPGVLYSLMQAQATPSEAGTIDQFLQGLEAQKRVELAKAANAAGNPTYLPLSIEDKIRLQTMGVDYSSVEFTPQVQANLTASQVELDSNGAKTVQRNADGSLARDKLGRIITVDVKRPKQDGGGSILGDVADFFSGVGHAVWHDAVEPVAGGALKVWNFADALVSNFGNGDLYDQSPAMADEMRTLGYDPNSVLSTMAFYASGKDKVNLAPLYDQYGKDKVIEALQFSDNPDKYVKAIENDPNSYETGPDGEPKLNAAATAKLQHYNSDDFQHLVRVLAGHAANIGSQTANMLQIDPVAHPDAYGIASSGIDIAASFFVDPLVVLGNSAKAAKVAQVGIKGFGDTTSAAKILDPSVSSGFYAKRVQRGWQRAIDLGEGIRAAHAAGDDVQVARLTSQFQAELPALSPIMDEFIGRFGVTGSGVDAAGLITRGETPGIRSLQQAAEWVERKNRFTMLANGRAAQQAAYMPGALSTFGRRRLQGALSGFMSARATQRLQGVYDSATARLAADPMLADKWVDAGLAERMAAQTNDAVAANGQVLAFKPDSVKAALGALVGAAREGRVEAHVSKAFGDELDDLESRLQVLMEDKSAPIEKLTSYHDAIQEGRALQQMADEGVKISQSEVKSLTTKLEQVEATVNNGSLGGFGKSLDNAQGLKSQARASQSTNGPAIRLTDAGKGELQHAIRANGKNTGLDLIDAKQTGQAVIDTGRLSGRFAPSAIAERFRLAGTRLTTLLPRNTEFELLAPDSGDKVYRYARTYLSRGDAALYRGLWANANAGERKRLLDGLLEQVGHAAGLTRTDAGLKAMQRGRNTLTTYSAQGKDLMVDGEPLALTTGQTRLKFNLPSFQSIQQASHRIGLFEATFGRALTSAQSDLMMAQLKMGWLFRPATVTRNMLEGWLRTSLEGKLGEALKARAFATARNKELWDRGVGLDVKNRYIDAKKTLQVGGTKAEIAEAKATVANLKNHAIVQHYEAMQAGNTDLARQIERATLLSGETLGRSKALAKFVGETTPDGKAGNVLAFAGIPFTMAGRAYRSLFLRNMDEETVRALETISPDDLASFMEGYALQVLEGNLGFANAAKDAHDIAKAGLGPATVKYALSRGKDRAAARKAGGETGRWTLQALDDTLGVDRFANHLHRLVDAQPETARAVLAHIEDVAAGGSGDIESIVRALDNESKHTAYGNVFFDGGDITKGRKALSDAERELGKRDWANHLVGEYHYLTHGQNGVYQEELAKYIKDNGRAPTGHWIGEHLKGLDRPHAVPAPETMAMSPGGLSGLAETLLDVQGSAYQWMVERPLQRTTSSPVFLAHYAEARKSLNPEVERLVQDGAVSRPVAEKLAQEQAVRQAWRKTEQLIDDPGQKAQFDVISRNFFPFSRATNAMIRRWGSGLWQNPVAAMKMALALEGAQHAGIIYTNEYGEPTMAMPISGAMQTVLGGLSQLPFVGDLASFPMSADLTGSVLLSVPGADNPFRFSMGPMVSIPMRLVYENMLPQSMQGDLKKLDAGINGPVGAGETWGQLLPTVARKFYDNMIASDRDSALASATVGAMANLAAAGYVPAPTDDPSKIKEFQARLLTQVRSQLVLRAVLGLFSPTPLSKPEDNTAGSGSDFAFSLEGIKSLSGEYHKILNDVQGDVARANAIFTALHPDQVVWDATGDHISYYEPTATAYEEGKSQPTTKGATLVSTDAALKWMDKNNKAITKYNSVAAYFIPKASLGDPFSQAAYDAQIEYGLRQRKTPDEFLTSVYTRNEEAAYYAINAKYDAQIAAAQAAGDQDAERAATQAKQVWSVGFKAKNPYLAAKLNSYAEAQNKANEQLRQLREMVASGETPDGHGPLLASLIQSYDGYVNFKNNPTYTSDQKKAARAIFDQWAAEHVANTPLADLFNGVFLTLDHNFAKASEASNQ